MKNKVFASVYAFAMIAGVFNAYFSYREGNIDAAIAWFASGGMAAGAAGAYIKLIEIDKEDEDNIS